MSNRVNPDLHHELKEFGAGDLDVCFNCGNCTAICPLSGEGSSFPRRVIHYAQVGLEDRLACSLDPWLCYYCGECSDSCPREANPGEIMMAARRHLTSRYDWTGLAKKFYLSGAWEVGAVLSVGLGVVLLFALLHGPVVTERVELNTFAPAKWVEIGDWLLAAALALLLASNGLRMARLVMGAGGGRVPLGLYISQIPTFITHFATQKRWRACGENHTRWLKHLLLVSGYLTMLVLVVVFLRWFQTDEVHPFYHPQRLLGYYATAVLLYFTVDFMRGRRRKREQIHKFSHSTDWLFLILLFLAALTGIAVHILRLSGLPLATYIVYVVHLAVVVPMLVVEVPFGKWSHLFYRPLAMYLHTVQQKARERGEQAERSASGASA
jgi:heterodisulfide reductase subunit C